jgi:hypothetical protein
MVLPMKRIVVGFAWTFALMWAGNYVALLTGISTIAPAMLAVAVGLFVAMDPLPRIRPRLMPQAAGAPEPSATVESLARP